MKAVAATVTAVELIVRGVVQGVGFRPFVHRLATRHGLGGRVRNESGAVRITVEGAPEAVQSFLTDLETAPPPRARIDRITAADTGTSGRTGFRIEPSDARADTRLPVPPDTAMCDACRAELRDPANRRFGYPFITCSDCGPRYTVIDGLPYDRARTSMGAFTMCSACATEYADPGSRRFHCETNSCASCGPALWLVRAGGRPEDRDARHPIAEAGRLLAAGLILGIRGLGGFHLAVDAHNVSAVRRLRQRKARDAKPLAVMVRSLDEADTLGIVHEAEARLLTSPERPVVLLRRRPDAPLAPDVAPGLDTVGVMIAYTPLHLLLLEAVRRPLVMTSGNVSDEPIVTNNTDALQRLGAIADVFLLHDRDIRSRYDDSVARVAGDRPVMLRRARGHAPLPLALPIPTPRPLLAVGPHLKNTFALAQDDVAWVSQHIGDLDGVATLDHFERTLARYRTLFQIEPAAVVHDAHPGYLSTRIAQETGLPAIVVQHHHAHLAAVAAEHGVIRPVVALTFDGTGHGEDGTVWGGEVLVGDLTGARRVGHLRPAPLPGGDLAARRPWRTALGYLSLDPGLENAFALAFLGVDPAERSLAEQQLAAGLNTPRHSSAGRLFDAAAAILGVRHVSRYEGHAAMQLEALAGARPARHLPFPVADGVLDPLPLLAALGDLVRRGEDPADLAARFHASVARTAAVAALAACDAAATDQVVLAGGVFQNARLLMSVTRHLEEAGTHVLLPRQLGPGDGAISYGQAAVAAARLDRGG